MSLDGFNIIAGLVTIASLFFSAWTYWAGKRKEAVEIQRLYEYLERLHSSLSLNEAAINQAKLIGALADREETSKKEIKHLIISMLASLTALNELVARGVKESENWTFGAPARYFQMHETKASLDDSEEKEGGTFE